MPGRYSGDGYFIAVTTSFLVCVLTDTLSGSIRGFVLVCSLARIRLSESIVHTHLAMGVFVTPTNALILSQNAFGNVVAYVSIGGEPPVSE